MFYPALSDARRKHFAANKQNNLLTEWFHSRELLAQGKGMSGASYSSHVFPSLFGPKHLGERKADFPSRACSQVLHLASATPSAAAAAATEKTHTHTQTQDGELVLPDSLHKILISQNSSTGLGICPTPFEKKTLFSPSLSVSLSIWIASRSRSPPKWKWQLDLPSD